MKGKIRHLCYGLTLVELLVALMVASIIFAAVASLAYAMGSANDSSEDVSFKQAQIRYTTVRLTELLRNCKLAVLSDSGEDLAVWRADDDGDNKIDFSELTFIEVGPGRNHIWQLESPDAPDWPGYGIPLEELSSGDAKMSLLICFGEDGRAELVPQCSNVQFYPASIDASSRFVSISFDLNEAGQSRHYQINANLNCRAGNLLNGSSFVDENKDDD